MVFFPNAKINIGLNIVGKRTDGFHDIETIFYPIGITDILEFIVSHEITENEECVMSFSGLDFDKNPATDLCVKAYQLLANDFKLPSLKIHLHKNIPIGAGLGGGSSDAAFMVRNLNQAFNLGLSNNAMEEYASKLGSDCAFFLQNEPKFASGRGNVFAPTKINLKGYFLVLVCPDIHVSTKEAYSNVIPAKPERSLYDLIQFPVEQWRGLIVNDFEKSVFTRHPEIKKIKEQLYSQGALYASMSGSGSSVYGIFKFKQYPKLNAIFEGCYVWTEQL